MALQRTPTARAAGSADARAESRALWFLLAVGALLMLLAAAARGDDEANTVARTDRFQGKLVSGATIRVTNVSGDVVASPGSAFSAVVVTTVSASSKARASRVLDLMHVVGQGDEDGYHLEVRWPGDFGERWPGRRRELLSCRECRITSKIDLTVPPGMTTNLQTVNGDVRARDVDGDLELHAVNGSVVVTGARRAVRLQTVNGRAEASAVSLSSSAAWTLATVNGSVLVTLPKDAKFDWSASTMGGTIASTFALPARNETVGAPAASPAVPAPPAPARAPKPPRPRTLEVQDEDGETAVDADELAREIEDSMRDVEVEIRDSVRKSEDAARNAREEVSRLRIALPTRSYSAAFGGGGAQIKVSSLNGNITLLAAGTREADARPLVLGRRSIVVTVPRVEAPKVRIPRIRVQPIVIPAPVAESEGEDVVRGDVAGDFLSSSSASYQVGKVSGHVKILSHSGEIHVGGAGNGAELRTLGGDIHLGPVHGDLRAQTAAGDVTAGDVTGAVTVETSGGDIRIDRVGGFANARTSGGDVVLPAVAGGLSVETEGGEVRIGVLSRQPKGGIRIRNGGGDVTLILPSNFQGDLELSVDGTDPDETSIRSEFPEITVTRREESQRAAGVLNGGGCKVSVRTESGMIRVRRGPAAGS